MADVSKITLPNNGGTFDLKDAYAMQYPYLRAIDSKTYTDVIASANNQQGAGFFYLKVRGSSYNALWHVKVRVRATVPSNELYLTDTIFDLWGCANTYSAYSCNNHIRSTGYRPIYYNSVFMVSETGYNNNCGSWIGVSLFYSTNPTTATLKRTIVVDLLEYDNCTVELQNSLVTPDNIPNRASHTNWYASTNTNYTNFDACSQGLKQSGDANSTNIYNLYRYYGNYIADSVLYRYQMLFETDENTLTPLNNDNNVLAATHTMLTDVEFDPFKKILFYNTTTTVNAGAAISAGALYYAVLMDLRYSLNIASTLTAHKPFYLVVTPTSNGKCKIASTTPWAQALPTTADGNWYILIGRAYSTYQVMLYTEHPVYMYDGEAVRKVLPPMSVVDSLSVTSSLSIDGNEELAGDLTIYKDTNPIYVGQMIRTPASAISIPAEGNTVNLGLYGVTSSHVLVAWRFSESPENAPPCDLTWKTVGNGFSITNTKGTSSETIQPVFALPNTLAPS